MAEARSNRFTKYFPLLLDALRTTDPSPMQPEDAFSWIRSHGNVPNSDLARTIAGGSQSIFQNDVHWARFYLKKAGLISSPKRGLWALTPAGRQTRLTPEATWELYVKVRDAHRPGVVNEEASPAPDSDDREDGVLGLAIPNAKEVLSAYHDNPQIRGFVEHNLGYWRNIAGSWTVLENSKFNFRPREEYWWPVERRVLVSYFVELGQLYSPPDPMRQFAFRIFRHFDQARQEGRLGKMIRAHDHPAHWPELSKALLETARRMPELDEYSKLGPRRRRGTENSGKENLIDFLEKAADEEGPGELEDSFRYRLPWFPYLGLTDPDGLRERQTFFAAFYTLFASTNSYKQGGAQTIAPLLQNNYSVEIFEYVRRWSQGKTPAETRFDMLDANSDEKKDRSEYAPVVELYTFLNLPQQPIYNNAARYGGLEDASGAEVYARLRDIGTATRDFLKSTPAAIADLSKQFREIVSTVEVELPIEMEQRPDASTPTDPLLAPADVAISRAIRDAGIARASKLSDFDAAAALYHLMIDSFQYAAGLQPDARVAVSTGAEKPDARIAEIWPSSDDGLLELPPALLPKANDALAFLRADAHVLFAGSPGTGKTTLAQFVAHAWDQGLKQVDLKIPRSRAPFMTVGNSAWAPFHTIGGILPGEHGRFQPHTGIFIDPACCEKEEWQLRPCAVVLDEMNRADLDRAIGELYPILSRSAESVAPAGIPRVRAIRLHPRFRIVATVNDSTLDDIVFPISEGLARRFVRIELQGATREDVWLFLSARGGNSKERTDAAREAVVELFSVCKDLRQLTGSEEGDRLPFGAGYFNLLAAWASRPLQMSDEFERLDLRTQARRVLATSISSAARNAALREVVRKFSGGRAAE